MITTAKVPGRCAAELEEALPEAIAACEALAKMRERKPFDLAKLRAAANRVTLAVGLVGGFAHMSR